LPNYQVFDERRYFVPAQGDAVFEVLDKQGQSVRVGLLICEDAWFDAPVITTCAAGAQLLAGGEWKPHKIQGWTPDFIPAVLNREIFENIYFAALEQSHLEALQHGPYETFTGSPAAQGTLQPDLWTSPPKSFYLDWDSLRTRIQRDGLRNSLVTALMPTASTSQVLGYTEAMEPFTSNIYVRRTLAGEFSMVNKYLIADLIAAGLWSPAIKERIIAANGSVQGLPEIPFHIKERYKTVWEIKQKTLIDMAADRGPFICQSQSLNLFVQEPTIAKLSSMHFYAWKKGLKTGIYYLRTRAPVMAQKFTVDPELEQAARHSEDERRRKLQEADEGCVMCSA
jgi:ribonucleoside-diphosphate reductase alpha chain